MLPCVWCCMNPRMDSSLQSNDGILLCHLHLFGGVRGQKTAFPLHIFAPLFATERRGPSAACSLFCPGLMPMAWAMASRAPVPCKAARESSASPEPSAAADEGQEQSRDRRGHCSVRLFSSQAETRKKKILCSNPWPRWTVQFKIWQN